MKYRIVEYKVENKKILDKIKIVLEPKSSIIMSEVIDIEGNNLKNSNYIKGQLEYVMDCLTNTKDNKNQYTAYCNVILCFKDDSCLDLYLNPYKRKILYSEHKMNSMAEVFYFENKSEIKLGLSFNSIADTFYSLIDNIS